MRTTVMYVSRPRRPFMDGGAESAISAVFGGEPISKAVDTSVAVDRPGEEVVVRASSPVTARSRYLLISRRSTSAACLDFRFVSGNTFEVGGNVRPLGQSLASAEVESGERRERILDMRRIRYQVACSLDGYIAGPNDEIDWIPMDLLGSQQPAARQALSLTGQRVYPKGGIVLLTYRVHR